MNRIRGILFHTLKGSPGWSEMRVDRIDIARVVSMTYDKRLFKIFDRDKPYTLTINYYLPETQLSAAPTFGCKHGYALYNETVFNHPITKRYKTEKDIFEETYAIQFKMHKLDSYKLDLIKSFEKL